MSNNDGMPKSIGSPAVLAVLSGVGLAAGTAVAAPNQPAGPITTSVEADAEAKAWWAAVARAQAYRDQLRPPADAAYAGLPVAGPFSSCGARRTADTRNTPGTFHP